MVANQKSADCHALHDERVDQHRGMCIGATEQYVVGVGGGRVRDGGDEQKQKQVVEHEAPVNGVGEGEQVVMVKPDHPDDEEAQYVGCERRPLFADLSCQWDLRADSGVKVEGQQRDCDREYAIAEGLKAALSHVTTLSRVLSKLYETEWPHGCVGAVG